MPDAWDAVQDEAVRRLQALIRIDTTNPPGNEAAAADLLAGYLRDEGFEPTLLAKDPNRPSVIARLPGRGERGPLLLQGHTDVVPADPSEWSRPPFSGDLADGCVWGRGALDMKGTLIMQLTALALARRDGLRPAGDIIFCAVPDEEVNGTFGAAYLVDEHPDLVRAEAALGEVGGYTLYSSGQRFYPIQVTEKVNCFMEMTVRGLSGHGSLPVRDGAMAKAAALIDKLARRRLPVHLTPVAEAFIGALAQADPALIALLDLARADAALAELGPGARMYEAILCNTATPTMVNGGVKANVIPGAVTVTVDGRLLPGQRVEDFLAEVRTLIGEDVELTYRHRPSLTEAPRGPFFEQLGQVIRELDPGATPVPFLLTAVTDARYFARLGAACYGFAPVRLSQDLPFWELFHSADERIPVDGLRFGIEALYRVIERW